MRLIGFSNYPSKYQKKMLIRYGYGKFPMTVKETDQMDVNGDSLIQGEHNRLPTNQRFFIIEKEEQTQ